MTPATGSAKGTRPRPTMELGETLRDRRELRRLSIQAAATQAGISVGYQYKLESGFVRTPSPRVLSRLSVVLDLSYQDLMRLAGYPGDAEAGAAGGPLPPTTRDPRSPTEGDDSPMAGTAPTNRRILRLLEGIRDDLAALRADVARLHPVESSPLPRPTSPAPE